MRIRRRREVTRCSVAFTVAVTESQHGARRPPHHVCPWPPAQFRLGRVPTGSCEPTVPTRCASRAPPRPTRAPDSGRRPADSSATSGDESGPRGPSRANRARDSGRWMCPTRTNSAPESCNLGHESGTRRTDSAPRVGGPAARLGAREGPRLGTKVGPSFVCGPSFDRCSYL